MKKERYLILSPIPICNLLRYNNQRDSMENTIIHVMSTLIT